MKTIYSIPPLLTLICFAGLAVLTLLRGRKTKTNILFIILCTLGSFLYLDILLVAHVESAETALTISRIDHFFIVFLIPVYIHFFHTYLNVSGRRWLVPAAYIYALILAGFTPTAYYIESMQPQFYGFFAKGGIVYPFFGLGAVFVTVYILIVLAQAVRAANNSAKKKRLKYVFAGLGLMGLMNSLDILPLLGYSIYPPGNLSFVPLIIFGIGLFRHDLLDTGFLLKKGLIYSILTALLTCLYALVILGLDMVFKDIDFSRSTVFPILFFLLIALLLGPVKNRIQTFVDRVFYRGRSDYRKTIKNVSQMIVSVLDIKEIGKRLTDTIVDALMAGHCELYLKGESSSGYVNFSIQKAGERKYMSAATGSVSSLIRFVEEKRKPIIRQNLLDQADKSSDRQLLSELDKVRAEIVLPMVFKTRVNGFVILGEKLSGALYSREEMDLLETLASQTALAVENARSYSKIEDLNKNLERKVAERTLSLQRALAEKEKTQEQLVRSESLAAIGQLVAGVAHELNNPLASVKSLIQTTLEELQDLSKRVPLDPEMLEDLRFADKELRRAAEIVKSLLGLSRQTQTYAEAVSLNTVVQDALRILYNQYKDLPLNIVESYGRDLPDIQGNFANLGQVALNIIRNAIQAVLHTSGKIMISTRFDNRLLQVVFECSDTGPGIPESIRRDIFKPFFTTKAVGEGTGLGLYICHEIVTKHGGSLKLKSNDWGGASFAVHLPA